MSNVEAAPAEELCGREEPSEPTFELMHGRQVQLTPRSGTEVTRTLPNRERRMVGAWCFLDHYGPTDFAGGPGMSISAHPHTGLQTVSWLVQGEIHHYDSLGNSQAIRPGQLNLMTAGRGIAHAELSSGRDVLHGAQLWVALPGDAAAVAPHFEHHADLPVMDSPGAKVTVMMGSLDGAVSQAETYSPLLGAELALDAGSSLKLPLRKEFEHALLALSGTVEIGPTALEPGPLLYLGKGREEIQLTARGPSRALLIGGEPFNEKIVMWWNFVGRSHEEIVAFREEWQAASARFGHVSGGYEGGTLPAPPMPNTRLKPRGRMRF